MENRFWQLLEQLDDRQYKTAANLGKDLGLSEKTVRKLIKEVNTVLRGSGAQVLPKQKYGYQLVVSDEAAWLDFLSRSRIAGTDMPRTSDERMYYLLNYLLSHTGSIKLGELGDQLYVSAQTLSAVLHRVEDALAPYHITIERKPYYGIRAVGAEFDKRCCLLRYFSADSGAFRRNFHVEEEQLGRVFSTLMNILPEHQIRLTEVSLQNLAIYIYLSRMRMEQGFCIEQPPEKAAIIVTRREYAAAQAIWRELPPAAPSPVPVPELQYTAVYIAGKRNVGGVSGSNFVITEKTDRLAIAMLDSIYRTYQIDLRANLNLRMMLNQHLLPLDIRLRYGIPVDNPILQDIKRDYFMAYTMADQAAVVLREHYRCAIPETELGWLALIFQMAVEAHATPARLNVLIVCASGKASSQLLLNQFRRTFGAYLNRIETCTIFELEHRDLSGMDYLFTTVPIPFPVSVPILEIHDFIKYYELQSIKKVLQKQHLQFLQRFYRPQLFFTDLPGDDRDTVLQNLCARISDVTPLPDSFLAAVLKREALGATDYGNLVAIPHPYEILTQETVVAVAILEKPIHWNTNPVQLIILVALSLREDPDTPRFYNATTQFMTDEAAVRALLADPNYDTFMDLLCNTEPEEAQ